MSHFDRFVPLLCFCSFITFYESGFTVSDPLEQLVRHFLIETSPRGVKIKGCQNEPYFGTLHSIYFQLEMGIPVHLAVSDLLMISSVFSQGVCLHSFTSTPSHPSLCPVLLKSLRRVMEYLKATQAFK